MNRPTLIVLLGCYLVPGASLLAAPPGDSTALAQRIDHHLAAAWKAAGVQPAAPADDAEFVRRVYLDLAGRIPSVPQTRAFLADTRPDKRRRLVEELLHGPSYARHFSHFWRDLLVPESSASPQAQFLAAGVQQWLSRHLKQNTPYDVLVHELLTVPVGQPRQPLYGVPGPQSPISFYQAKEFKPENLAASTARLFLGVKLECAQCHNHPFAAWKREQFWGLAAFFAGLEQPPLPDGVVHAPSGEKLDRRELTIPGTQRVVQAAFLDGRQPKWKIETSPRVTLADWITSADNPYFARAAVNRLWAYFFGIGLIDPVDDIAGGEQTASHPELLDELARSFAEHDFNLHYLIRAITASQAYQLTSARTRPGVDRSQLFACMPLRGLSGEQLFASIVQATGYPDSGNPNGVFFFGPPTARQELLAKFSNTSDRPTEVQTSILQALAMMNGPLIEQVTHLDNSVTLSAILDAPFMDARERIETLYLAVLSRLPSPRELSRCTAYIAAREAIAPADQKHKRRGEAHADLFWALLNTSEFLLNH